MTSDYGMALNPFHVLQMICLQPKGRSTRILTNRADGCRKLFGVKLVSGEHRGQQPTESVELIRP